MGVGLYRKLNNLFGRNKIMAVNSERLRQSMSQSFKNVPNLTLKGSTYDAPHLEKFIIRPKTASLQGFSPCYIEVKNKANNAERKENIDTVYTNQELLDLSQLQGKRNGNSAKLDANDAEKHRNPIDYENTKYDRFIAPYETLIPQEIKNTAFENSKKLDSSSIKFEPSKIVVKGTEGSGKHMVTMKRHDLIECLASVHLSQVILKPPK